jgi:hypothetical protein
MKKLSHIGLIALILSAAVMLTVAPAYAIKYSISGQINRAVLYANDGDSGEWFFVDNSNSSTRFRFKGSNKFKDGWKVGLLWEVEMKSNPSSDVNMDDDSDIPAKVTFNERHMDIWVGKKAKLRLGQGDTASNGTSEVDLSGTTVAAYSRVSDVGGGFEFKENGRNIGVSVKESRNNFDGLSRRDRLRVDTPRWEGFYGSVSFEGNSEWDLAVRYAGNLVGWGRLAAAAGWADYGNSSDSNGGDWNGQFSSSASMRFNSGLSLTASYAYRDQNGSGSEPTNLFGKIGYTFKKKHIASVQYSRTKHLSGENDEADTLGLAYVFSPWRSVEFYGTYYLHMLDRNQGSNIDDIDVVMAGARVKF